MTWPLREGGPIQRREDWKARKRLSTSDFGVFEHYALCAAPRGLAAIEEANVANIVGVERPA